jgi:hypothetical protein
VVGGALPPCSEGSSTPKVLPSAVALTVRPSARSSSAPRSCFTARTRALGGCNAVSQIRGAPSRLLRLPAPCGATDGSSGAMSHCRHRGAHGRSRPNRWPFYAGARPRAVSGCGRPVVSAGAAQLGTSGRRVPQCPEALRARGPCSRWPCASRRRRRPDRRGRSLPAMFPLAAARVCSGGSGKGSADGAAPSRRRSRTGHS